MKVLFFFSYRYQNSFLKNKSFRQLPKKYPKIFIKNNRINYSKYQLNYNFAKQNKFFAKNVMKKRKAIIKKR
jgi:hypothetical protein